MIGTISQHALRNCRIDLEDRVLDRAGIFPFFDEAGRVRLLMITAEETGRILLATWVPDVFTRRWPRRYRLRLRFTELSEASPDDHRLEALWHYDPWWVLGDDRYRSHDVVPVLRSTNIHGYDTSLHRVWFASDLATVAYVVSGSGESRSIRRFDAGVLTASVRARPRVPARRTDRRPTEWRLRPFWQ